MDSQIDRQHVKRHKPSSHTYEDRIGAGLIYSRLQHLIWKMTDVEKRSHAGHAMVCLLTAFTTAEEMLGQ